MAAQPLQSSPWPQQPPSGASTRPHVPQPQWEQFAVMRDYAYTHTQPQWSDVRVVATPARGAAPCPPPPPLPAPSWAPAVLRPPPLEDRRVCMTCLKSKERCTCRSCVVCRSTFLKNRHHCRRCWRAVCSSCWGYTHRVHMLGRPMPVCDRCSVPWAIANASKRDENGLRWGLYALRLAGEMPRVCVDPQCRTFTRRLTCCECGLPTVVTQPHCARVVRANGVSRAAMDAVNLLDVEQLSRRAMEVNGMTTREVEGVFRRFFHNYEELLAFRTVTTGAAAQRILLAGVAAAVAYEYVGCPNLTLGLSDIPYARVLQLTMSRERYSVLEAPGRVKYITFPGTHNWRTWRVDLQFSRTQEEVWTRLHEGLRVDGGGSGNGGRARDGERYVPLCGGVRKAWSYYIHGGFAREAREVGLPLDALLEDVRSGGYSLVLCGHSLGGAIAQFLTLELLHRAAAVLVPGGDAAQSKITCITFGAPLLGNYELADHVHDCGWTPLFHNIVYRSDIVPRVFCTDEIAWDAQSRVANSLSSVVTAAQDWWRGRKNTTVVQGGGGGDGGGGDGSGDHSRGKGSTVNDSSSSSLGRLASAAAATSARAAEGSATPPLSADGPGAHPSPLDSPHSCTGGRRSRTSVLSSAVRKAAAVSLGLTGSGLSDGLLIAEADSGGLSDGGLEASMTGSEVSREEEEEARLAAYMDTAIRTSRDLLEEEGEERGMKGGPPAHPQGYSTDTTAITATAAAAATATMRVDEDGEGAVQRQQQHHDAEVGAALSAFSSRVNRAKSASTESSRLKRHRSTGGDDDEDDEGNATSSDGGDGRVAATSAAAAAADVAADVVIPNRRMHRRFTCFGRYHFVQFGAYGYVSTDDSETAFGVLKHGCGEVSVLRDHSVAAYNRGLMIHLYRNLD